MAAFQHSHSPLTKHRWAYLFFQISIGWDLSFYWIDINTYIEAGLSVSGENIPGLTSHLNFRADGLRYRCESLVGTVSQLLTPGPLTGTQVGTFPQEITPEMIII